MPVSAHNILPPGWADVFSAEHPRIGIGIDPATTTKKTSNPSSITVTQQVGLFFYERLVIRMKTEDPEVFDILISAIHSGLRARGLAIRRLCILATNERFFAVALRKRFAGRIPVSLVIESEKTKHGGEEMSVKAYLGNLVVNAIDDGYLPIPDEQWLKRDFRSVVKDRGTFDAEILEDGGHGDCFSSAGAALHALKGAGGKAEAAAAGTGSTFGGSPATRKLLNPFANRYRRSGGKVAT